jgi:GT2 family glycosyltransferase
MKFSLITVNYNGGYRIKRCMAAMAAQSHGDFEAIFVDNASSDGSENTPVPDDRFRWLYPKKNLGFAAGNNLAVREAKGEWIFLVNPDAYLEPECLAVLHSATLRHPDCVLFGCTQLEDRVPEIIDGSGDCYFVTGYPWRGGKGWGIETLPDEGYVWGPCGAAYLMRRDVFEALGGFDEDFFCYCEDLDLNFRAHLQGYNAIQVVEAFLRHEGSGITGEHSPFSVFHGTRNRFWVFVKNMPDIFFWPLLLFHLLPLPFLLLHKNTSEARIKGMKAAWVSLPGVWKKRQAIQKQRKISLFKLACMFSWNPFALLWRRTDVRKFRG